MPRRAKGRKTTLLTSAALVTMLGVTPGNVAFAEGSIPESEQYVGNQTPDYSAAEVKVNQVGYLPGEEKIAIVTGEEGNSYQLLNADTNEVVKQGTLGEPAFDENSGDYVRLINFSDVTEEGEYEIVVDGIGTSFEFSISEDVYEDAFTDIARSYTLQRSNTAINDPITGLELVPGHGQDEEASMFFSDEFHEKGDQLDVEGGWYDAGDYGKYITPAAVTVGQLLMAYELNPDYFTKGQFSFPEGISEDAGNLPDLLAEVKFELNWMEKMQRPDGAVYHKVSGTEWPGFITPAEDTQDRVIYGLSTYTTGMYAGTMAQAARIFEAYDPEYAEQLLDNAVQAQEYLEANPEPYFRFDEGQDNASGDYRKDTDKEERLWAAAELLKTTGEEQYDQYLQENFSDLLVKEPTFISWDNAQTLGQWAYVTSEKADKKMKQKVEDAFLSAADDILNQVEEDGYFSTLEKEDYTWASNKKAVAKGNILLMAHQLKPDEAYEEAALEQIHYIFGRNATDTSYVTGIGESSVDAPHHRISRSKGLIVPGLLVGGPNINGGDPYIEEYVEKTGAAPGKAYLDYFDSYATNEYAIDYNAPLFFMLSYFNADEGAEKGGELADTATDYPVGAAAGLTFVLAGATMLLIRKKRVEGNS